MTYNLARILPWCIGLTWLFIAAEIALGFHSYLTFQFFADVSAGAMTDAEIDSRADMIDGAGTFVGIGYIAVLVVTFIVNAIWLFRASTNAKDIDADPNRITPKGSVLWYIVPIANFWMPYKSMRQTWNSAHRRGDIDASPPGFVKLWWIAWALSNLLSNVSFRMSRASDDLETLMSVLRIDLVAMPFSILSAYLFMRVMNDVTEAQNHDPRPEIFA